MAKFYAFENTYGIGTRHIDNNERVGTVMVFNTPSARDQWVRLDLLRDGRYRRESITAVEARREMVRVAYNDLLSRHVVWRRADVKHVPMDEIIRAYSRAMI